MELFDTHAHYDAEQFDPDRDGVLAALPGAGVALVVNPGCDLPSSEAALSLAAKWPFLYAAVGYHPDGLDYYWEENPPRELQRRVFRDQMALARELDLPVIVHDREAHGDSLAVVRDFPQVRGVFHCFSGSAEMAKELVRLGWMISFTGVLTYKNARKALEAAAAVPMDRLMLETDSPYMAPVPHRGKRCDSRYLVHTCRKLAEIKGIAPEECARITLENGRRFFGIPPTAEI